MTCPEHIHSSNTIQNNQVIFGSVCVHLFIYICMQHLMGGKDHEFEREK